MNRLVKNNLNLIVFISVAFAAVCVLLVWTALEHSEMSKYSNEVTSLRETIGDLIEKKPAPVKENLPLIQKDIETYQNTARNFEEIFKHPMTGALEQFVAKLEPKSGEKQTPEEFRKSFREEWDKIDAANVAQQGVFYKEFQRRYQNWDQAMLQFRKQAEIATTEPISGFRVDEIFLASLGVPRAMEGKLDRLHSFMREYRDKLIVMAEGKVALQGNSIDFSFPEQGVYKPEDIPKIVAQWDVIGDIVKRIVESGVGTLTSFSRRSIDGEESGDYRIYHYSFEVTGKIEAIRNLAALLDAGARYKDKDSRFYIVRSIFLYSSSDPAKALFQPDEKENADDAGVKSARSETASTGRSGRRRGIMNAGTQDASAEEARLATEKRRLAEIEADKKRPFYERRGYGDALVGAEQDCRAIFDVDYVVYNGK